MGAPDGSPQPEQGAAGRPHAARLAQETRVPGQRCLTPRPQASSQGKSSSKHQRLPEGEGQTQTDMGTSENVLDLDCPGCKRLYICQNSSNLKSVQFRGS